MKMNSLTSSLVFSILISSSAFSIIPSNNPVSEFFESNTNEINLYKLGASDSSDVLIEVVLTKNDTSSENQKTSFISGDSDLGPLNHKSVQLKHENAVRPEVYVDWSDDKHHSTVEHEYLASMGASW